MPTLQDIPVLKLHDALLFVGAASLVVHAIYKKYEFQPTSSIPTFLLLIATPYIASTFLLPHFASSCVVGAYATGFAVFYTTLLGSIALYRLSPWHPLAKYPGPRMAKLTKFWSIVVVLRKRQLQTMKELHEKYGKIVRVGPNELSIADADLVPAALSPDMPKGPMWDGRRNPDQPHSLISCRTRTEHAQKRVPWNYAFNSASLKEFQPVIIRRASQLADELEKRSLAGETVDLGTYFSFFAFDFMGDMAFGGGFELLRDGDVNGIWKLMSDRNEAVTWQQQIPWATRLLRKLPFGNKDVHKFQNFAISIASNRLKMGSHTKDLFYYLNYEGENNTKKAPTLPEATSNGLVAIIAGSDTTSVALTGVFYHLLNNPVYYARLRKEVDEAFPPGEVEPFDATKLAELKFMNAVINETLRLQPAVPTLLHRAPEKGTGGKWIGEHFINENTAVNVAPYVIHRDAQNFSPFPNSFWPDRWMHPTEGDSDSQATSDLKTTAASPGVSGPFVHNLAAYMPFSIGHANCAGKNLALAEMRLVIALLMQRYDMQFAPGYDAQRWDADMQDFLILKPGDLHVVIKPRF